MVDYPERGKPLGRDPEGRNEYYRENERSNVMFVRRSNELGMTDIAYTRLVRNERKGLLAKN